MENQNTNTTPETDATMEAQEQEAVKTYTQEEVLKLLQSEADKRVNQALAKQKKEYEKKLSLSSLDEQPAKGSRGSNENRRTTSPAIPVPSGEEPQ